MDRSEPKAGGSAGPGGPQPLAAALQAAWTGLRDQSAEQIVWLGAQPSAHAWRLPVLNDFFEVDPGARRMTTGTGREVGSAWRILALHYLAIRGRPELCHPELTFADLPTARTYASVYRARTVERLCATVGRTAEPLERAARALGGLVARGGDLAFDFRVFPRLTVRLIWHAPDQEFPPCATLLLPGNIEAYLPSEDIVVVSELLVARLAGRPF